MSRSGQNGLERCGFVRDVLALVGDAKYISAMMNKLVKALKGVDRGVVDFLATDPLKIPTTIHALWWGIRRRRETVNEL